MGKKSKYTSLILFGSAAWMVCAVALPMNHATGTDRLVAKVSNLVISQAYADDDKDKSKDESKDEESKSDDESKDDESKDEDSTSTDFSSATSVCVSRSSVLSTLGLTSDSDDEANSDDESKDDEAKSDDESKDDEAKSDDESKDDESKSDDESSSDDTVVTEAFIESLSGCTAIDGSSTVAGVWVPDSAVGDSTLLNEYFSQVSAGTSAANPESSMKSFREIHGQ